jgi:hypothetical protein
VSIVYGCMLALGYVKGDMHSAILFCHFVLLFFPSIFILFVFSKFAQYDNN